MQATLEDRAEESWAGPGYVYFLYMPVTGEEGYIKVGWSSSGALLRDRIKSHQSSNPIPLELVGVIATKDKTIESDVHRQFKHLRAAIPAQREWFNATLELRLYIETNTQAYRPDARSLLARDWFSANVRGYSKPKMPRDFGGWRLNRRGGAIPFGPTPPQDDSEPATLKQCVGCGEWLTYGCRDCGWCGRRCRKQ